MADLYTEGLGAAGRVAVREQSERDPGAEKRRRPAKTNPRNDSSPDSQPREDSGTPAHRVDRLA